MGMKCVMCGTDNNLKERTDNGGRCKNCNHLFAFDIYADSNSKFRLTDAFFAKAIKDISANNTLYYTRVQLFYLLERRLSRRSPAVWNSAQILGCLAFVLAPLCLMILKTSVYLALLPAGIIIFIYGSSKPPRVKGNSPKNFLIAQEQFQDWLNRWQEVKNPVGKMLPPPREERLPAEVSTELTAYSFDRAVICDSAIIAQLLIANNFHFENNCAVLSVTGYPQSIFSTVLEMLNRNPDLKVYALHNASPRGVTLTHHLRTSPNWFQNRNVIIYDLGLLPRQIVASRNMFVRASEESAREAKEMPVEVRQSLSASELEWLEAGNFVELESFTPQKLMQVLNQGIVQSQSATAGDSLVVIDGGGDYLYAADSFG